MKREIWKFKKEITIKFGRWTNDFQLEGLTYKIIENVAISYNLFCKQMQ